MVCIYCSHKTKVTNSRSSRKTHQTWRRRECLNCGSIITTREQPDPSTAIIIESATSLEPLQRDKLFMSLHRSLSHRKSALRDAGELTDTILGQLYRLQVKGVVGRGTLLNTVLSVLERFDSAGATYYRAHYQD
jgi:transcriptional regulator NrdR family protein